MNIRFDILYLRFLSILSIILYHFNDKLFQGGYLGVDILLVLTSYLNINSILNNIEKHDFSYFEYIVKRSKRLLPSSLLVLCLCKNYISDIFEICSVLFFSSNYYYYKKNIDYFHQYDNPSPILHYWCLSLEYQFYFVIPFILMIKYNKYIIISLTLISLCIYLVYEMKNISYCYYCLLPRLYQFLITYFVKVKSEETKAIILSVIFTILHIFLLLECKSEYVYSHIIYTLLICVVINYNYLNNNKFSLLNHFSKISYSLYLVHYPIIIICEYHYLVKILIIFISSILLYVICEKYLFLLVNKINKYYLIMVYIGTTTFVFNLYRFKENLEQNLHYNWRDLWNEFSANRNPCKVNPHQNNCTKILLMGDSHMDQWIAGIYKYYSQQSIMIYFINIDGMKYIPLNKMDHIISQVESLKQQIELILLCNFNFGNEFRQFQSFIDNFDNYYIELQKKLLNYSSNIVILNDNPHLSIPAYECLNDNKTIDCYCILGVNCTITDIPVYSHKNIRKCDMNKYLCKNNKCPYLIDNKIVYVDDHHLSPYITKHLSKHLIDCLDYHNNHIGNCGIDRYKNCSFYIQ